jgi:hypothetical protein
MLFLISNILCRPPRCESTQLIHHTFPFIEDINFYLFVNIRWFTQMYSTILLILFVDLQFQYLRLWLIAHCTRNRVSLAIPDTLMWVPLGTTLRNTQAISILILEALNRSYIHTHPEHILAPTSL